MSGVQCPRYKVKKDDNSALHQAVEAASKEMMVRTAVSGFLVLCDSLFVVPHQLWWLHCRILLEQPYNTPTVFLEIVLFFVKYD